MNTAFRKTSIPLFCFAIYFVYPIPHTVALRYLLLGSLLSSSLWILARNPFPADCFRNLRPFRTSGLILLALSFWLLIQSAFISPLSKEALGMLRGDWLNSLIAVSIGLLAVLVCQSDDSRRPIHAATTALVLHILALFAYQIWIWAHNGTYPLGRTPFAEKDYHSMLVTTLSALILADMLSRSIIGRVIHPLSWPALSGILVLSCIASVTLLARNAVIINALLIVASGLIFVVIKRKAFGQAVVPLMLVLFLAISSLGWFGLQSDARWQGFSEAVTAAIDTKNNLAWLNTQEYPLPLMRNGKPVEESAYSRIAWAKVGVEQIAQYPLGLGYGHKAFGWAVNRSYHVQTGHESSHCGLLDFTLANGIPGLLLWLALSIALMATGWRAFMKQQSPAGLALAFSVSAYLVRCLVDGHLSGFRLAMYAFLIGLLVMLQSIETKQCN